MMAALFATSEIPSPTPREEDESRSGNKEHLDMEAARKASIADEEARQIRAVE